MIVDIIGVLGAGLLALCGLPQAIKSYQDKHSNGISWGLLGMWGIGEVLLLAYIALTTVDIILIINYAVNLLILTVIIYFRIYPDYSLNYLDK